MSPLIHLRFILLAALALFLAIPVARAEGDHCPDNPKATSTFNPADNDFQAERDRLAALARPAAKAGGVCILAFYDPDNVGPTKKLAISHVTWARDLLVRKGVPRNQISIELRAVQGADKTTLHSFQVILGH